MDKLHSRAALGAAIVLLVAIVGTVLETFGRALCGAAGPEAPFAVCPHVEDNEALISIIALVIAIICFWLEYKRANRIEQESRDRAREQESKDRKAAEYAQFLARKERSDAKTRDLREFLKAVFALIDNVELSAKAAVAIMDDDEQAHPGLFNDEMSFAREAFEVMLPAAPLDAELRLLLQRLKEVLSRQVGSSGRRGVEAVQSILEALEWMKMGLDARRRSMEIEANRRGIQDLPKNMDFWNR